MRKLVIPVLLFAFGVVGAAAVERTSSEAQPALRVELYPFKGVIPAAMANGRPVYRFHATVADEKRRVLFAHAETLLQSGMTREIHFAGESAGEIRGVVTIGEEGSVEYRVQFSREGHVVMETAASMLLPVHP